MAAFGLLLLLHCLFWAKFQVGRVLEGVLYTVAGSTMVVYLLVRLFEKESC